MHLSNAVRSDITFSVNILARFMQDFDATHWHSAKHILRYLKGTREAGIVYQSSENEAKIVG